MKILSKQQKGQTLIETAFILIVILLILLGISEFSRAWFVKNTLKNAVRQGARVAAVTPRDNLPTTNFNCVNPTCPDTANPVKTAVCCQAGVPKKAENWSGSADGVTLTCKNQSGTVIACNTIISGGSVDVNATSTFLFIIGNTGTGNSLLPWPKANSLSTTASMRYE